MLLCCVDVCVFHPGVPVFHDAMKVRLCILLLFIYFSLKGWSCCKKRCIDFTDFLNIPVSELINKDTVN